MIKILLILSAILFFIVAIITASANAQEVTTELQKNSITENLNICAKYEPNKNCDIVPQNTKIPIDKIPFLGKIKGDIYA